MEKFIKYQRIEKTLPLDTLQDFFDELVAGGWEILYYREYVREIKPNNGNTTISLVIITGKKQSNIL